MTFVPLLQLTFISSDTLKLGLITNGNGDLDGDLGNILNLELLPLRSLNFQFQIYIASNHNNSSLKVLLYCKIVDCKNPTILQRKPQQSDD